MVDMKLVIGVVIFFIAYILFRIFFNYLSNRESEYEKKLNEILVSDKYKVKGRHD